MFTQTPENYQSFLGDLVYRFETEYTTDIIMDIRDFESGETLGVKKFYSSPDLYLNIAPIINTLVECSTPSATTGFVDPLTQGCVTIEVEAFDSEYDSLHTTLPLTFTLSRNTETTPALLTTLAQQRLIASGERDLLTLLGETNAPITAIVKRYSESAEEYYTLLASNTYTSSTNESGLAAFALAVDESETCDKIEVSIVQSGEEVAAISYFLVENPTSAMRLAWVSSRGAIEHYTFAEVKARAVKSACDQITLLSAYEAYDTRWAIAEVISASQVWLFVDGQYREVEVVSSSIDTAPLAEIALVEVCVELAN
ncbi:MAG: hypothetical protein SNH63_05635 [Rikenellaceae bacterium]